MNKYRISNIWLFIILFLFIGCNEVPDVPNVNGKHYFLSECKQELLDANDYKEEDSIDHIIVEKKERKIYLYKKGEIQTSFPISLGKNPIGNKVKRGDFKTPEGTFWIHRKLCSLKYYRSLCISYPSIEDKKRAKKLGVDPGGDITIHAQPKWNADGNDNNRTLSKDWTQGCVAVTNKAMNQLWYSVREGVPITIR